MKRTSAILLLLALVVLIVVALIPSATSDNPDNVSVSVNEIGCTIITNDTTLEGDNVVVITDTGNDSDIK